MSNELLPLDPDDLREAYVEHVTDLLGKPPTIEDWYRFEQACRERSRISIRNHTDQEREDLLLDEALRQCAAETGMTYFPLGRKRDN